VKVFENKVLREYFNYRERKYQLRSNVEVYSNRSFVIDIGFHIIMGVMKMWCSGRIARMTVMIDSHKLLVRLSEIFQSFVSAEEDIIYSSHRLS
jgi:hypothetical protein